MPMHGGGRKVGLRWSGYFDGFEAAMQTLWQAPGRNSTPGADRAVPSKDQPDIAVVMRHRCVDG